MCLATKTKVIAVVGLLWPQMALSTAFFALRIGPTVYTDQHVPVRCFIQATALIAKEVQ